MWVMKLSVAEWWSTTETLAFWYGGGGRTVMGREGGRTVMGRGRREDGDGEGEEGGR